MPGLTAAWPTGREMNRTVDAIANYLGFKVPEEARFITSSYLYRNRKFEECSKMGVQLSIDSDFFREGIRRGKSCDTAEGQVHYKGELSIN